MRVCLISTTDSGGGAPIATGRLHQGLTSAGIDNTWLVGIRSGQSSNVTGPASAWERWTNIMRVTADRIPLWGHGRAVARRFSVAWVPDRLEHYLGNLQPDVINLHWISGGFIRLESLARIDRPIVWTLHDMWAFTGGCHYTGECARYLAECGRCPVLDSRRENDLSRWVWKRKSKIYADLNLTIVAPSNWLAECARSSPLVKNVRIEVIPNGVDIHRFLPADKRTARQLLGLPEDRKLILMGAVRTTEDVRKGFDLLVQALKHLSERKMIEDVDIVIFGASRCPEDIDLAMPVHCLGTLDGEDPMVLAYSAADVFVAPSREDNLPNTVMESMACGTPVVAFKVGGMQDMIDHRQNGYLAQPLDTEDLARGIYWVLSADARRGALAQAARKKIIAGFSIAKQAQAYLGLYKELAANSAKKPMVKG